MTRKKKRHKDDDIFRLEQENRELKKLNRSLLKELKKRNKGIHRSEIDLNKHTGSSFDDFVKEEKIKIKDCFQCGKGILTNIKIRHLTFESCNLCEYKKKL